jgi:hypothetical protein
MTPKVDHLGVDALGGQFVCRGVGFGQRTAVRDEGDVGAGSADRGGVVQAHGRGGRGEFAGGVAEASVLEDQHRVGVDERGGQHVAGVLDGGGTYAKCLLRLGCFTRDAGRL